MATYERFDHDASPAPPPTSVVSTTRPNENLNLIAVPSRSSADDTDARHAMITLNIISIFIGIACGVITFLLAIEEFSMSALGFATDTILDVLAYIVIIWRFISTKEVDKREKYVLRILACLFFGSGCGIFTASIDSLYNQTHPLTNSYLVIAATVQTVVFSGLGIAKFIIAKRLHVISAYSDAFNTLLAGVMALSVAVGITIYNSHENIWYIDPIIGMFISLTIMGYGIWMMYKSFRKF